MTAMLRVADSEPTTTGDWCAIMQDAINRQYLLSDKHTVFLTTPASPGVPPTSTLFAPGNRKYNTHETLRVMGFASGPNVNDTTPVEFEWSISPKPSNWDAKVKSAEAGIVYGTVGLSVSSGSLLVGQGYTISLTVGQGNMKSIAELQIIVNEPPSLGRFVVSPTIGDCLTTDFYMEAPGWFDEDLPVSILFGYMDHSVQPPARIPLGAATEAIDLRSPLPVGDVNDQFKLKVFCEVYDGLGAVKRASCQDNADVEDCNVKVKTWGLTMYDLKQTVASRMADLKALADSKKSLAFAALLSLTMKKGLANSRRQEETPDFSMDIILTIYGAVQQKSSTPSQAAATLRASIPDSDQIVHAYADVALATYSLMLVEDDPVLSLDEATATDFIGGLARISEAAAHLGYIIQNGNGARRRWTNDRRVFHSDALFTEERPGSQVCEDHGFDQATCNAIGCCRWDDSSAMATCMSDLSDGEHCHVMQAHRDLEHVVLASMLAVVKAAMTIMVAGDTYQPPAANGVQVTSHRATLASMEGGGKKVSVLQQAGITQEVTLPNIRSAVEQAYVDGPVQAGASGAIDVVALVFDHNPFNFMGANASTNGRVVELSFHEAVYDPVAMGTLAVVEAFERGAMTLPIYDLPEPIELRLYVDEVPDANKDRVTGQSQVVGCAFWDESTDPPRWNSQEIETVSAIKEAGATLVCKSTHATAFAPVELTAGCDDHVQQPLKVNNPCGVCKEEQMPMDGLCDWEGLPCEFGRNLCGVCNIDATTPFPEQAYRGAQKGASTDEHLAMRNVSGICDWEGNPCPPTIDPDTGTETYPVVSVCGLCVPRTENRQGLTVKNEGICDCADSGVPNGGAIVDCCGICNGGNANLDYCGYIAGQCFEGGRPPDNVPCPPGADVCPVPRTIPNEFVCHIGDKPEVNASCTGCDGIPRPELPWYA